MSASKNYYRIMLGQKSSDARQCHEEQWFGGGYQIEGDLTDRLPDNSHEFNKEFIPVWLDANPGKSKSSASRCCGMLWWICKGIQRDDIVLCPDGTGNYWAGEVIGDYFYVPDPSLPHRRKVQWYPDSIARSDMSEGLRNLTGLPGTVRNVTKHCEEIETLLAGPTSMIAV